MQVILEDDLVDSCKSGDDITIYGVVMQRWKPFKQDVRCEVEIVLRANYVQVNNEQSAGVNMDEEVQKEFGNTIRTILLQEGMKYWPACALKFSECT